MENDVARGCDNTVKPEEPPLSNISAVLYSNSGLVPITERPYTLRLEDQKPLAGKTDAQGYISHRDVPVGDYLLEIDGVACYVPTDSDPNARLPIKVDGYFLIGEADENPTQERLVLDEKSIGQEEEAEEPDEEGEAPDEEAEISSEEDWEDLTEEPGP